MERLPAEPLPQVEQRKQRPFPRMAPPFQTSRRSERFHRRGEALGKGIGIE
jgi:hypothetical protein